MKRAFIAMDVIVWAIIGLLILVLVIAFATGSFSKLFGSTKALVSTTSDADIIAAQNSCSQLCLQAGRVKTEAEFNRTSYCTKIFSFDINGDGNITDEPRPNGNEGGIGAKCISDSDEKVCCRDSPISTPCQTGDFTDASC
jgi:hypothetical protein